MLPLPECVRDVKYILFDRFSRCFDYYECLFMQLLPHKRPYHIYGVEGRVGFVRGPFCLASALEVRSLRRTTSIVDAPTQCITAFGCLYVQSIPQINVVMAWRRTRKEDHMQPVSPSS